MLCISFINQYLFIFVCYYLFGDYNILINSIKQEIELKYNSYNLNEFIHIAKNGGRAIKYMHNKDRKNSPFTTVHGHRVRASHILGIKDTSILLLCI